MVIFVLFGQMICKLIGLVKEFKLKCVIGCKMKKVLLDLLIYFEVINNIKSYYW